ncbi:ribosome-associated heat shock protein Hsp15 [Pokkaliibacter sp. MBI-7]|uniref:Ribosome-associated heat shock protein Hsp15 n=1 Tax=Proteobacteria bacterium 228 TaxID=2083153 RepID=A0A2S5KM09_9PROT|nr:MULTISPECIES: ribosome-associated heat shock protein Hsp15 [Pokkaliibacter]MDH2432824.1 ribosome-associated heat shock protein Hsp15 [Pokkaliibacter sp. MBI-7]PPC75780.1 ribosome-associated heat shock protein Hsp15 [Pokkaliibacter plantistimulans]
MSKKDIAQDDEGVRLDKWLWAARFFKTRNLAKEAIEGGKVHYNGAKGKPSRLVEVGAQINLRQGWDEKTIEVLVLSDQRRPAPEAQLLYQETADSVERRERETAQRKANSGALVSDHRPSKKERRQIVRFKSDVFSG